MVPAASADGVGGVLLAVPPVAFVPYQRKVLPLREVAINALAVEPTQLDTLLTTGAGIMLEVVKLLASVQSVFLTPKIDFILQ